MSHGSAPDALEYLEWVRAAISDAAAQESVDAVVTAIATGAGRLDGDPAVTVGVTVDDQHLRLISLTGFSEAIAEEWSVIDRNVRVPLTDALRSNDVLTWSTRADLLAEYPAIAESVHESNHHAWASVSLWTPMGATGVIGLAFASEREFSPVERSYLAVLGQLGGEALRHAARDTERDEWVARLAEANEAERRGLAHDLHDEAIQGIAAILIRLGAARHGGSGLSHDEVLEIETRLRSAVTSLRDLAVGLNPPDLIDAGLGSAINDFARWLFDPEVEMSLIDDLDLDLPTPVATTAYRIAQEALRNVHKHARARHVSIMMSDGADGELILRISDDGIGISDVAAVSGGRRLGVRTMCERARSAGGDVTVTGGDGGTTVEVRLPRP